MGMIFSIGGALLIEKLRTVYKHYQELAIPIILSAGMGVGVIFISLANGFNTDLFSYLFGSVSAVTSTDLIIIGIVAIVVVATIILLYKELFLLSFDEEYAVSTGLRAKWIHFYFHYISCSCHCSINACSGGSSRIIINDITSCSKYSYC